VLYLPKVIGSIVVWMIGSWIIGNLSNVLRKTMETRNFDISLRGFLISLVSVGLKVLLLFSIAGMLGIETTSFIAVLGAAGLAVGLALQGSLANFAGGVLILIFKPFKVGDVITVGPHNGEVREIQIFNTILVTLDNRTIILANGAISNGTIINFSRQGTLGFDIQVELDGKFDFEKVREVGMQVLASDSRVKNAEVGIAKLAAGMVVSIKGSSLSHEQIAVVGSLNEKIKVAFRQAGFTAPESHTFVHNLI
jgi:small conductance mechanosensitive channel